MTMSHQPHSEPASFDGVAPLHAQALMQTGYTIVRRVAARSLIEAISCDLAPIFSATPFCTGDFYGERTKRFGRLLIRSPHVAELVLDKVVLALVEHALGPWCDTLQLNLAQAIEIHEGALIQFPHRDQDMWRGETGRIEYLVNVMWPLVPFTRDNGATVIWQSSHGEAAVSDASPVHDAIDALADPGDAIVFLGSTLHGGGSNRTPAPRQAIIISYCLGWLKPYENQWLAYPPEIARTFSPELAGLVGYRQHRPNLGNIEGLCPSVLLGDGLPDHVSAVDALTPEQTAQLGAFVAEQRRTADAP